MQGEAPLERYLAPSRTPATLYQNCMPRNILTAAGCAREPLHTRPTGVSTRLGGSTPNRVRASHFCCLHISNSLFLNLLSPATSSTHSEYTPAPSIPTAAPKEPPSGWTRTHLWSDGKPEITLSWSKLPPDPFQSIPSDGPAQLLGLLVLVLKPF